MWACSQSEGWGREMEREAWKCYFLLTYTQPFLLLSAQPSLNEVTRPHQTSFQPWEKPETRNLAWSAVKYLSESNHRGQLWEFQAKVFERKHYLEQLYIMPRCGRTFPVRITHDLSQRLPSNNLEMAPLVRIEYIDNFIPPWWHSSMPTVCR